jgi:hypothetical protein
MPWIYSIFIWMPRHNKGVRLLYRSHVTNGGLDASFLRPETAYASDAVIIQPAN